MNFSDVMNKKGGESMFAELIKPGTRGLEPGLRCISNGPMPIKGDCIWYGFSPRTGQCIGGGIIPP
ncbi:MAG: hypothetical protein AYK19_15295 [Theionarchaea archaeon DG-70-1]|nr:MAG: hypothetical protein AYK19_15295 [Theionarchaea archaeon DG-70-1]